MKKWTKIIAGIIAFILIGGLLWFANGLVGNPISKMLANRSTEGYIEENYPEMELELKDATYNFKNGRYNVCVKSPTSIDTHFSIDISPTGEVVGDSYSNYVLGKFNTWNRINIGYRKMVKDIFEAYDFPYESDIDYGELKLREKEISDQFGEPYGLNRKELEIDHKYNIKEIAKDSGHIVFYTEADKIDSKKASEILLDIKNIFDDKSVPFYAISFTLQEPMTEENKRDRDSFNVREFLYSDIYEEGLVDRLEKAAKDLDKYYKEQDIKKEKEIHN